MSRFHRLCTTLFMGALGVAACGDTVNQAATGAGTGAGSSTSANGGGGGGATAGSGGGGAGAPQTPSECLADHRFPIAPDYDPAMPVMASHCKGTNHQDITGIEKLVIVGDSIAQGTSPTPQAEFFRNVLADKLTAKFPGLEVAVCAQNGARMGDLQGQFETCFPDVEPKVTLIVSVMGGNDVQGWAVNDLPQDQAIAEAAVVAGELRSAVQWLQDDTKFPAGMFLIFSNVYEYTDGTADLGSCPGAAFIGLNGTYIAGANGLARLQELLMQVAADTQTDMILMGEEFCGHGYRRDLQNSCYLGPDAENWFDITCTHPTPTGHTRIAELFELVVDE